MNEQNDLMQNIGGSENNNLRKYLILGGGVFVLFVIGIVIAKFMFSSPKKDNNTQVILADNMKADVAKDTKLFNDIPIENETNNNDNQNNTEQFKKPVSKPQPQQLEEVKSKTEQPKEVTISQPKQKVEEIKTPKKLKVEPKKEIVKKTKTKTHQTKKTTVKKEYYLQVAAVTRGNPSSKFLKLITKNGFKYKIVEVNIKGMKVKRVLVGAFTYKEAKQALPKVRQKISSSAFIKRLK